MVKKLLVILILLNGSFTYAETIKTDVLVIGNGASAITAAMQSARSKLKTVLIVKGGWMEGMQEQKMITVNTNRSLPSGIWGDFRKEIRNYYKTTAGYDTTYNAPLAFEPFTGAAILKKMADTVKRLTIKLNAPFTSIKKNGTGWDVTITVNGKTDVIKAKVVIDATETGEIVLKAKANLPTPFNTETDNQGNLYRTSIAVGDLADKPNPYTIPMRNVVVKDADNLLITDKALPYQLSLQYLPIQMTLGQGVGTIAAYCAFFKTTTKELKVRPTQIELLDFKGLIMPFDDIDPRDPYYRAIQQIGAIGLLKGVRKGVNDPKLYFMPDSAVTTAEVQPVLTEVYTRAFLWFNKVKPGQQFTVGNLLSFISEITLSEPKPLQITIQKAWKTEYKFTSDFDTERPITRREFAILTNKFLNPFARTVDMEGNVVN